MRLDLRLHGRLDDGRECSADISVYCTDSADKQNVVDEATKTAPWLVKAPGWPDVPDGANITVEHVEDFNEERAKKQTKTVGPMILGGPPGSLPEFLRMLGAGEFIPFPEGDS